MLTNHDVAALMRAEHHDPFSVLGLHTHLGERWVSAVLPGALSVEVVDRATGATVAAMVRHPDSDVFSVQLPKGTAAWVHQFRVQWHGATDRVLLEDPYRFPLVLQDLDLWLLAEGTHQRPFECLGAHLTQVDGVAGTTFAVWAPNALRVSVVGSFNQWDGRRHPMRMRREWGMGNIYSRSCTGRFVQV
jgi:1,4-alpha-glucan branching enzyme